MKQNYRVYFEDTDAGGIMYHANYLKFAERGRTEALIALGIDQFHLKETRGLIFVIARIEIDYKRPAILGDMITVETTLKSMGRSSLCMEQHLTRDSETLSLLQVTVVLIDQAGKPQKLPDDIGTALQTLIKQD